MRYNEKEAAKLNIHGVPYFIFENGLTASSALSTEDFRKILKSAAIQPDTAAHKCGPDGCVLD